jgi:hypothetical protein
MNLNYKDISIEIIDDKNYSFNSSDNKYNYDFIYKDEESDQYDSNSKHGIILKKSDSIIASALLCGVGGAAGVTDKSAIVENDNLLECVANKIFCLSLPDLKLHWIINPDWASCFQIFKTKYGFIIHGESVVSLIDISGKILWSFGGKDIFVNPNKDNEIELKEDYIKLTDWEGRKYKIDYSGNEIE